MDESKVEKNRMQPTTQFTERARLIGGRRGCRAGKEGQGVDGFEKISGCLKLNTAVNLEKPCLIVL